MGVKARMRIRARLVVNTSKHGGCRENGEAFAVNCANSIVSNKLHMLKVKYLKQFHHYGSACRSATGEARSRRQGGRW